MQHDWSIEEREYFRQEERRGRRHAFASLEPARTALVVVDLVAFFIDENAYARGIVASVNALADALRGAGGTVAWVVPAAWQPSSMKLELLGPRVEELYRNSGGTGSPRDRLWGELATSDADLFVEKAASSAFFPGRCPLHELLQARGIDTVLVTGTLANVCCEATARDASTLDYRTIMVADANAARRDQDLNATLYTIYRSYGDVRTTDDLLAMITASRDSEDRTVYEAAGGADGMFRLAHAWHERVMADDVVSHAFSHGFRADHTERLAAYWAEALGGPADYSASYGDETTVVQMHSGNGEHDEMDRRAIACFDQAMADIGLTADEPTARVLHDYFAWATTTTMGRYHRSADDVPHGLTLPKWSWDGLVAGTGPDDA
ncbi:MAG TPA: isochorismatase family protein [Acidimicrobiales bacterium]|nr:isochorismatase family protein [Acidimicrobiales bacterium]